MLDILYALFVGNISFIFLSLYFEDLNNLLDKLLIFICVLELLLFKSIFALNSLLIFLIKFLSFSKVFTLFSLSQNKILIFSLIIGSSKISLALGLLSGSICSNCLIIKSKSFEYILGKGAYLHFKTLL